MTFSAKSFIFKVLLLQVFVSFQLKSQGISVQETGRGHATWSIPLSARDSSYQLPHEFLVERSETVLLDSMHVLKSIRDYTLDYRFGIINVRREKLEQIFSDSALHMLSLSYRVLPLAFKREYFLRQVVVLRDTSGKEQLKVSQPPQQFSVDDYFGTGLQKSGSITRGFIVGSSRDLSLSSGFRMQLSGKLSQDVDVVAALTDENSPIQPEGMTQTLREVDKVFIELKSTNYGATLGDFNTEVKQSEGGEFARLQRKLQGARGTAMYESIGSFTERANVSLIAATSRGKYHTNQFQGIEGNQGPYRLTGRNGEQRLIIVAGSERIYLNGNLMTRGEINDYTIDYSSGEVVFRSRRLITNASRIVVDFEYTDRQFTRNFISGSTNLTGFSNALNLNAVFVQEADDPDSPIDVPLDESSRKILEISGNDRFKASFSGIQFVGRDSLTQVGKGQYIMSDSTINGRKYSILRYAPGDSLAFYTVTFSQVDQMHRDSAGYIRVGIGQFRFAGVGIGNYLPVQFLPMPQLQRTIDFNAQAQVSSDFTVSGEYAVSEFDRNRLSFLDDQDKNGSALKFVGRYNPRHLTAWNANLGELDVNISERFVGRRFASPDRFNEVEFNRAWNLESAAAANEEIREASIAYKPISNLSIGSSYGFLDRQGQGQSTRLRSEVSLSESSLPVLRYQVEDIKNSNSILSSRSSWTRQRGDLEYIVSGVKPGIGLEAEDRRILPSNGDSVQQGSFRFFQFAPRISFLEVGLMSASAELQIREEDSSFSGSLQRAFQSFTQMYSWQLREWQSFSSNLTLSIRNTQFVDEFKARGNVNSEVILVRSTSRFVPPHRAVDAETYYEFSSQRSARLERAFVRVAKGNGNYFYKGDINGNGVADENEFELTRFDGDFVAFYIPSDQLYPVVELKTSLRVRLQLSRFVSGGPGDFEKILRAISTETFVRIDEKSSDPDAQHIYFLNFQRFQNDATTIAGSNQLTQDLFLFENSPDLSFRFRYSERSGLLQLVSANERSYQKERSVRIRSQLVREVGNQTDYSNKTDRVTSTGRSLRVRDLVIDALSSDFSYRPEPRWEVGFTLGLSRMRDHFAPLNAEANINEQGLRIVYAIFGAGQIRSEIRREEVTLSNVVFDPLKLLPYEFTNGKATGKSYLWQLAFDYRINQNMQVTLHYNGRSEGGRRAVHLARAEARAFF